MPDHASAEYRVCASALDVAKLPAITPLEHFANDNFCRRVSTWPQRFTDDFIER
jgi:hypothetical protein